jgi:hypothetical protein
MVRLTKLEEAQVFSINNIIAWPFLEQLALAAIDIGKLDIADVLASPFLPEQLTRCLL